MCYIGAVRFFTPFAMHQRAGSHAKLLIDGVEPQFVYQNDPGERIVMNSVKTAEP